MLIFNKLQVTLDRKVKKEYSFSTFITRCTNLLPLNLFAQIFKQLRIQSNTVEYVSVGSKNENGFLMCPKLELCIYSDLGTPFFQKIVMQSWPEVTVYLMSSGSICACTTWRSYSVILTLVPSSTEMEFKNITHGQCHKIFCSSFSFSPAAFKSMNTF